MSHEEFFRLYGQTEVRLLDLRDPPPGGGYGEPITLEDLFQQFKARLLAERRADPPKGV